MPTMLGFGVERDSEAMGDKRLRPWLLSMKRRMFPGEEMLEKRLVLLVSLLADFMVMWLLVGVGVESVVRLVVAMMNCQIVLRFLERLHRKLLLLTRGDTELLRSKRPNSCNFELLCIFYIKREPIKFVDGTSEECIRNIKRILGVLCSHLLLGSTSTYKHNTSA